jgi:Na+:H+ antiporter, NhaA family
MASRTPRISALPDQPPEAWEPLLKLARLARRPLDRFLQIQAASGILLLLAATVALVLANSRWADAYRTFWQIQVGVRVGPFGFERSLEWIVNDILMAVFFFVVGLEIRREVHHGELSELRRAALPAAAALGGMVVPALLYLALAGGPGTHHGWGVPMATDIAFAVGILTLLGDRVPAALRVLLLALAVIDDLGAILVIAFFYSSGVEPAGFGVAALGLATIFAMQRLGVRNKLAYVPAATVTWAGIYAAGVHPTIAGVLVGVITPVRAWLGPDGFVRGVEKELATLADPRASVLSSNDLAETLRQIDLARREAMSPAESLIETLHPWVAFGIMPVFAFANAGVTIGDAPFDADATRVMVGVLVGLVVGKPLGVWLVCATAVKTGLATVPAGVTVRHLIVLGVVAGVGFTMSIFIAQLAFPEPLLGAAKLGVLVASVAAGLLALILGRTLLAPQTPALGVAVSADEAESSTEA